jgi:hypothetical protein
MYYLSEGGGGSSKFLYDKNQNSSNFPQNSTNINTELNIEGNINPSDIVTFDEFCNIFQKIYDNSQKPEKIFLEGFYYMDQNK